MSELQAEEITTQWIFINYVDFPTNTSATAVGEKAWPEFMNEKRFNKIVHLYYNNHFNFHFRNFIK